MKIVIDTKKRKNVTIYILVAVLAAVVFCCIYGVNILNPGYTDWLVTGGDLSQHYLGWVAYRYSSWHFPIGLTDRLAYPACTSVIFTDSIPLFAVVFKILSPVLPENFQYFGFWGITCFALQGIFSARIIKRVTENRIAIVLGSLLAVIMPTVFFRLYGHEALAGQWLIVFVLDLLFAYEIYEENHKKLYLTVAITAVLAVSIHMYFLVMCGIIVLAYCVEDIIQKKNVKQTILILLEYCFAAIAIIFLLGGFVATGSSYELGGLGAFSMNLNSLFNPFNQSAILKELPLYTDAQGEGFGYLGAGVIVLGIAVLVSLIFEIDRVKSLVKSNKRIIGGLLCTGVMITIIACQTEVTFGARLLYKFSLPAILEKLWGIFRASGRMVMVLDYVIVFSCMIYILKSYKKQYATAVFLFGMALGLQMYDIHPVFSYLHSTYSNQKTYESPLYPSEIWDTLAQNEDIKHVIVTYWLGENQYYDIGKWALENDFTMSSFAMVHATQQDIRENILQYLENPTSEEIFIFSKEERETLLEEGYPLYYYDGGDYIIGYAEELKSTGEN